VDQPRHDLLARARLAPDQHAGVGVGDLVDALQDQPHGGVVADHGHARRGARAAVARRLGGQEAHQRLLEHRDVEGLAQHVGRADAQRLDGVGDGAVGREGDDRDGGRAARASRSTPRPSPSASCRSVMHRSKLCVWRARDRLGAGRSRHGLVPQRLDEPQEPGVNRRIVVNEQDLLSH